MAIAPAMGEQQSAVRRTVVGPESAPAIARISAHIRAQGPSPEGKRWLGPVKKTTRQREKNDFSLGNAFLLQ
jgi:hypothetical protein